MMIPGYLTLSGRKGVHWLKDLQWLGLLTW